MPEPNVAMRELARVTKPGGQVWLSAPLFYEEHEQPYDFHRYTQFAWRRMAAEANLDVVDIGWLEGYYGTLQYQLAMAARVLPSEFRLTRIMFGVQARRFGRLDRVAPRRDIGMCKNYRVVLTKPSAEEKVADVQVPS